MGRASRPRVGGRCCVRRADETHAASPHPGLRPVPLSLFLPAAARREARGRPASRVFGTLGRVRAERKGRACREPGGR